MTADRAGELDERLDPCQVDGALIEAHDMEGVDGHLRVRDALAIAFS
jgi:hypothetical protein